MINSDKVIAVIKPDAAPVKRMIQTAKDNGTAIDATCGRKTKAVIVTENNALVLSALLPETISSRINSDYNIRSESIE